MSNHDKDKNLDEYLTGDSGLSSLYQGSNTDNNPGMDLDNTILAAARREVNSKPHTTKKNYLPFSNNYFIPLSTAATVFIVIAVVSFFPEQQRIEFQPETVTADVSDQEITLGSAVEEQEIIVESKEKRKEARLKPKLTLDRQRKDLARSIRQKETVSKRAKKENVTGQSGLLNKAQLKQRMATDKTVPGKLTIKADSIQEEMIFPQSEPSRYMDSAQDVIVASAPVINSELIYDSEEWKNLTADEWRRRIIEIYHKQGEADATEIIKYFNKMFKNNKLTIQDIIQEDNKK